ncbi:OmpH family outer membrane protein [Rubellimicrobium arenae]|uniref:OmpH family outer membrane protein n=1 Tax=Rubellimicrobium arenae TaxID=2817372 RepID=UPI001B31167C|nr:OmpH family outer membrane protein [Rubellimicrobium arenae]
MRALALIASLVLAVAAPQGVAAQTDLSMGQIRSPILTIDVDRLLSETRYGRRINEDLKARTEALAAENDRLATELTAEERALTDRRPSMEVEAFRSEAEAFDTRVQSIRSEQDAKQRELEAAVSKGREDFLNAVTPVLARLMIDSGAAVILERRDVFLSVGLVDITDEAITAIDQQLGEGQGGAGSTTPTDSGPAEAPPSPEPEEPGSTDPAEAAPGTSGPDQDG